MNIYVVHKKSYYLMSSEFEWIVIGVFNTKELANEVVKEIGDDLAYWDIFELNKNYD